jgi:PTH1 family peptidyl-tRNA hydrolase
MKIVFGLGNPGSDYRFNRHNAGFLLMEQIYQDSEMKFGNIKKRKDFFFLTVGHFEGVDFVMIQPRLFMNVCGKAFLGLGQMYDFIDRDILVLHDDISFELGRFKLKQNGGDGGHKGVRSIIETLDSKSFSRLKIGIQSLDRTVEDLSQFVLENFTQEELGLLTPVFPEAIKAIKTWLTDGIEVSMNRFNVRKELQVNNG